MLLAQVNIKESFEPAGKITSLASLVNNIVPIFLIFGALTFLIMLLRGAFIILAGEGKPENVAKGQKTLMFAVIGLIVMILAFTIVKLVGYFFQVNDLLPL
jgi:hypothetical protein